MKLADISQPCYARHLGLWSVEPRWFQAAVAAVKSGAMTPTPPAPEAAVSPSGRPYRVDQGVAVIEIAGPVMKGGGSFGEVNSIAIRRAVRDAARDPDIGAIMLLVDSPGGTVAGTEELANDVRAAEVIKPVFSYADDLMASAAYWIGSQAREISANATAEVGSIGTLAVVEDISGMAEAEGIKVHVVSTGAFKGAFVPGAPVPPEHLEQLQTEVNDLNQFFLAAVKKGRGVPMSKVEGWADGRVYIAGKAQEMGLIDHVEGFDAAMERARKSIRKTNRSSTSRAAIAIAETQLPR